MIKARHTIVGKLVCNFYSGYKMNRAFQKIIYEDVPFKDTSYPILILSNHFCWWDGFIQYRINKKYFGRTFHVMMLEEQLRKYTILNKGGAFSICKNSRSIIESLDYTIELLKDPSNMVLLFPQGKIQSLHIEKIIFETGLNYILKHLSNRVQLVFNVNLPDYFEKRKPTLHIYTTSFFSDILERKTVEERFNDFYIQCKIKHQQR